MISDCSTTCSPFPSPQIEEPQTHWIPLLNEKYYLVASKTEPKLSDKYLMLNTDKILKYVPLKADFGPLSLNQISWYVQQIRSLITNPEFANCIIVHHCDLTDREAVHNAVFLSGCMAVISLNKQPEDLWNLMEPLYPHLERYRDVTDYPYTQFNLKIVDCWKGLHGARMLQWFSPSLHDVDRAHHLFRLENGNISEIIPDRLFAMSSPLLQCKCCSNDREHLQKIAKVLQTECKLDIIVRLNDPPYDKTVMEEHGIRVVDLVFPDGTCPSSQIIQEFSKLMEQNPTKRIAVHCKAGLGRTGTVIGTYFLQKYKYFFTADSFMGFIRMARKGSVIASQQDFLQGFEVFLKQKYQQKKEKKEVGNFSASTASSASEDDNGATLSKGLQKVYQAFSKDFNNSESTPVKNNSHEDDKISMMEESRRCLSYSKAEEITEELIQRTSSICKSSKMIKKSTFCTPPSKKQNRQLNKLRTTTSTSLELI